MTRSLPPHGQTRDEVLTALHAARTEDIDWRDGRLFSLVYSAGPEATVLLQEAYALFLSENALNPGVFPSLRRFEAEVLAMSADLLGGGPSGVVGNMTSGGTESILLAVKTARDWARHHHPERQPPEIVVPASAHPAFDKAGHYFGVQIVRAPIDAGYRADVAAVARALSDRTIMIVASAPSYPHGVVDPVTDLAALAKERGLLCHVDACMGGFMLPFVRRLGYPVPAFDFTVPGVTSLSADLHKYGYAAKGASVILYRDRALRRFQLHAATDWSGGIYASPSLSGSRPGGAIAAAWAIMHFLGEDGYLRAAAAVMESVGRLRQGIAALPELHILGDPDMSLLAIGSQRLDIYEVGDEMTARGWHLDRQQHPPSLHLTISAHHAGMEDLFLADLAAAVVAVRRPGLRRRVVRAALGAASRGARAMPAPWLSALTGRARALLGGDGSLPARTAPLYGMLATLPNRGDIRELVLDLVEGFTTLPDRPDREG